MDGFVVKKPRIKESEKPRPLEVFKPPPRIVPVVASVPSPVLAPASAGDERDVKVDVEDLLEEELDDRDEALDQHWQENAQKRQEFRERRKKAESLKTIVDHFKKRKFIFFFLDFCLLEQGVCLFHLVFQDEFVFRGLECAFWRGR